MRFDFSKMIVESNLLSLEKHFDTLCRESYKDFLAAYAESWKEDVDVKGKSSEVLMQILSASKRHASQSICILIDEYDNFTNQLLNTHQDQLYGEVTTGDSFLRAFFKTIKAGVG